MPALFYRFMPWVSPSLLFWLSLFTSVELKAQESCQLGAEACAYAARTQRMQTFYVRGDYAATINEVIAEPYAMRPTELFYTGMSYLGLLGETSARPARCYLAQRGKQLVLSFIRKSRGDSTTPGTLGSESELRKVYTAMKALDEFKSVKGCLESNLTAEEQRIYTRDYARQLLENIQFKAFPEERTTEEDALYQEGLSAWEGVLGITRGIVEHASQIESELQMKTVEAEMAGRSLGEIKNILGSFGTVTESSGSITVQTLRMKATKNKLEATKELVTGSNGYKKKFEDALSGMTAEKFAEARVGHLTAAKNWVIKLGWVSNAVRSLFPSTGNATKPVTAVPGNNSSSMADQLEASWRAYGADTCMPDDDTWYCRPVPSSGSQP